MTSSIDVLVPEAEPLISRWYSITDASAAGMPPHVTLLWPWVDAPVHEENVRRVEDAVCGVAPFDVVFPRTGRFPGAVYLAPEPRDQFDLLIARLALAFPDTPPYEGTFGNAPVPHLTAARSADEGALDRVEAELARLLKAPLRVHVDRVSISQQGPGVDRRWELRAEINLAANVGR